MDVGRCRGKGTEVVKGTESRSTSSRVGLGRFCLKEEKYDFLSISSELFATLQVDRERRGERKDEDQGDPTR